MFESAQQELEKGEKISDDMGPEYYYDSNKPDDFSEYIMDFDINKYLATIRTIAPKNGYRNYFNALATKAYGEQTTDAYTLSTKQMSLFYHLASPTPSTPQKWFVCHSASDASVPISESITLATILSNMGINVDFNIQWSGGYDCWELVEWIKGL